jgi:hypothetical protein
MDAPTLVADLERVLPGFSRYFESDDNLFDRDTAHAVFAACSHFAEGNEVAPQSWPLLGEFLNEVVSGPDDVMSEAACSCFLENLANARHPLKRFLRGEALRYWEHWEGTG